MVRYRPAKWTGELKWKMSVKYIADDPPVEIVTIGEPRPCEPDTSLWAVRCKVRCRKTQTVEQSDTLVRFRDADGRQSCAIINQNDVE